MKVSYMSNSDSKSFLITASDDTFITEVEEHIENRNIMTLNTQDKFVEAHAH